MILERLFRLKALLILLLLVAGAALTAYWLPRAAEQPLERSSVAFADLVDCRQAGFSEVNDDYQFRFPDDHLAHNGFCSEIWSFNGQLIDSSNANNRFGFQFSIARLALTPKPPELDSAWATNQFYRSHFAVTDVVQQTFYAAERFSRAALGLAGSSMEPAKVWVEHWTLKISEPNLQPVFEVVVKQDDVMLQLQLQATKPVLPANSSLALANAAFHAYWLPRLQVNGELSLPEQDQVIVVQGQAWLDRAWGAINTGQGQLGLNRFVMQFDDNSELLIIQLRRRDGSGTPINRGLLINSDNTVQTFERRDIALEQLAEWKSPVSGQIYPVQWRLSVPQEQLELTLVPLLDDQELPLSLRFWSGSVTLKGQFKGQQIKGMGHIELGSYEN